MIFVKAGKIATYHHHNAYSDFFLMGVPSCCPRAPTWSASSPLIKLLSGSMFLLLVGRTSAGVWLAQFRRSSTSTAQA